MKKRDLYYERIPTKLLREDIRLLGTFLGRVIKDQEGSVFFEIVEKFRLLSKNTLSDKNKNLWVAHFHGACVSVFNQKAKLIHRIQFPAKNITNCAFGGKNTKELYVSTATKGMGKADLRKFRYSGFFFSVKTNARGVLQKKFIISNEEKRSLL